MYQYSIVVYDSLGREVRLTKDAITSMVRFLRMESACPRIFLSTSLFSYAGIVIPEWKSIDKDMIKLSKMFPRFTFSLAITKLSFAFLRGDTFTTCYCNGMIA